MKNDWSESEWEKWNHVCTKNKQLIYCIIGVKTWIWVDGGNVWVWMRIMKLNVFLLEYSEKTFTIELLIWYIFCEVYNVLNPHVYFRLVSWRLFIMSRLTSPPILLNTKDCKKRNLELGFYMMQSFRTVMHVDYVVMSYYFKIWKMWK